MLSFWLMPKDWKMISTKSLISESKHQVFQYYGSSWVARRTTEFLSNEEVYVNPPEEEDHEATGRSPQEEVSRREGTDGGVVDGGVDGRGDHGHHAFQGAQHRRHFTWNSTIIYGSVG